MKHCNHTNSIGFSAESLIFSIVFAQLKNGNCCTKNDGIFAHCLHRKSHLNQANLLLKIRHTAKFIILNAKFLVFDTQFLILMQNS